MPQPSTFDEGLTTGEPHGEAGLVLLDYRDSLSFHDQSIQPHPSRSSTPSTELNRVSPVPNGGSPLGGRMMELLPIDYQSLDYSDAVDETLQCPICKTAFAEPVTTKACGHTFCRGCIEKAYEIQPICPIDRQPFRFPQETCTTRVIAHQLDRLMVACPNQGCSDVLPRAFLPGHYERSCRYTPVICPDPACNRRVARFRAIADNSCLHGYAECVYCHKSVVMAELELHYENDCDENKEACQHCNDLVACHLLSSHVDSQCPEKEVRCPWYSYGCPIEDKRRNIQKHEASPCVYRAIGQLAQDRADDRKVIQELRAKLAMLEASPHSPALPISSVCLGGNTKTQSQADGAWNVPEDFLLSQFAAMETRFEEMRKTFTELDSRHSMMLLNETLPLKNQITELRSVVGVVNMHTTWLMNFHRQQRSAAAAAGSPVMTSKEHSGPSQARISSQEESSYHGRTLRRLSDGRPDQAPRL